MQQPPGGLLQQSHGDTMRDQGSQLKLMCHAERPWIWLVARIGGQVGSDSRARRGGGGGAWFVPGGVCTEVRRPRQRFTRQMTIQGS